jgi:putative PIN family toxin of toxin-antitoxin system
MRIVLDTCILVAAARSKLGASHALLRKLPNPNFEICLSVSLYSEWQAVMSRSENLPPGQDINDSRKFLQYLASIAHLQEIHFLWRPFLPDPEDDMVLELAFAAGSQYIVTYNRRDFRGCEALGIALISLSDFLKLFP